MQNYEKLRGLLLLAREIRRQHEGKQEVLRDTEFPAEFIQVIHGQREVPSLEELQTLRPRPQHLFDAVVLKTHCEQQISQRYSPPGHHVGIDLTVTKEERG